MQDCSNSTANALELLQSCTKPSILSLYEIPPPLYVVASVSNDVSVPSYQWKKSHSGYTRTEFLKSSLPIKMWLQMAFGRRRMYKSTSIKNNIMLCAACWAHFTCHHELWLASVGHPLSFLNNSSWGLSGGKHYQNITIPIFRLVLQNFAIPGCVPYIPFYRYIFSLLSSGWFVVAVCVSVSVRKLIDYIESW